MNLNTSLFSLAFAFSSTVFAHPVIDSLSVELIKKNVSSEIIEQRIEQWHRAELNQIDTKASVISDRAPIEERRAMVERQIEQTYRALKAQFDIQ
ncbi:MULTISPECIES: hypothetical protein [Vibrio]|uniref:Uncharacterized protein n=2 Tax=Vibrio fluvialis TaxID=676 RepID=A0AAX2LYV3_VIBFL|nr:MULTISPECIES: hypothetical protein [Vibrio]HBC3408337.1 hypothetical protein [Vibrio parahaemolyticus]AMF92671.1 hypothetical protein AL536_04130 [Vibrio fluvialis]AVH34332.1 hypothetical protein AL475_20910 [Vibrio fluvialis]EKO3375703.1 hypothetical protein [Vibrio fluvialis]EKO3519925.1 hypothetical protein [Vibrio fluvialis]